MLLASEDIKQKQNERISESADSDKLVLKWKGFKLE